MAKTQDDDPGAVRDRLVARRHELEQLSDASAESRNAIELDQSRVGRLSRMDAIQVQAMQVETDRRRALEIRQIDAALQRLEDDEYGYCAVCGEPIETRRLDLNPTVACCIGCARISDA